MVIARPPQPELPVNISVINRQLWMINVEQSSIRTRMRGIEAKKRAMGDVGAEQTDIHSVNYYEDILNTLRKDLKLLGERETALQDRRTALINVSSLARQEAEETAVSGRLSPFFNEINTNNGSSLGGFDSNSTISESNVIRGGKKKSKRKRKTLKKAKRKWSNQYKKSINCKKPNGFSQKQYCKYGRKTKKTKKMRRQRGRKV